MNYLVSVENHGWHHEGLKSCPPQLVSLGSTPREQALIRKQKALQRGPAHPHNRKAMEKRWFAQARRARHWTGLGHMTTHQPIAGQVMDTLIGFSPGHVPRRTPPGSEIMVQRGRELVPPKQRQKQSNGCGWG